MPAEAGTGRHPDPDRYQRGRDRDRYEDNLSGSLPLVLGFVLALTFLVMSATFRSVVVGLTAIVINLLSTLAAFGLLVLVFQHRWAEDLPGFSSTGAVIVWVPMFLFVILFGLSMDYHVFVVSRIREGVERGLPIRRAVAEGIIGSAGTVTSAAVVMVAVFSIFATLSMVEMKQLGVGLGVAVLIDVLVVRVVVLPSLMALLGRANWWPSRLSRPPTLSRARRRRPATGGSAGGLSAEEGLSHRGHTTPGRCSGCTATTIRWPARHELVVVLRDQGGGRRRRGHQSCPGAASGSVLVEVDEVTAGVVKDRVHAAVVHAAGLLDEHHTLGLEPLGVAGTVGGGEGDDRPALLAAAQHPRQPAGAPPRGGGHARRSPQRGRCRGPGPLRASGQRC